MKKDLAVWIAALVITLVSGAVFVPLFKKIKFGQPILKYVKEHESKSGTPTMGGLFFIIPVSLIFFLFSGRIGSVATTVCAIGLFYMLIGFLDDFIKIKRGENEGLKPYQKITFQTAISILAGAYAYLKGITAFYIPFYGKTVELGFFAVPLVAFIYIALTNSVNLTDGMDGLAASVSAVFLMFFIALLTVETGVFGGILPQDEYAEITTLSFALLGGIAGFLAFNFNRAKVFMGDTGSLALGGFLSGVTAFSGNGFFVPLFGVAFVWSSLSVIIQVLHFKRTKKRVFLMAPFHHHLQKKGLTEGKICYIYCLITVIIGVLAVISYL